MESNKFKRNVDKTDLIIIGTKQQRKKIVDYFPVKIHGKYTSLSDTVRNLNVVFLTLISAFFSTFHNLTNRVSNTNVISAESGVIYLYRLLKQYQLL